MDDGKSKLKREQIKIAAGGLLTGVIPLILAAAAYAGEVLTSFSFTTVEGTKIEYRPGEAPLVINVGSHWCPPCRSEAPALQKAYKAHREKGVRFLGVFTGSSDDDIREFVKTFGITYPAGKDEGIARKLGVRGIPVTVFVAKDGRIVKKHFGGITLEELETNIGAMLKGG